MSKRAFIITCCIIFFATLSFGQCPDKNIFLKRMYYLRDSTKLSSQEQLSQLLPYLDSMSTCSFKNDSVHAFLLRRIGGLYYQQGDYIKSLKNYRQYISISAAHASNPTMNIKHLPGGYYWLSVIYDSLRMVTEKWKALDNCTDIAEKIGTIDRSNLYALYKRMVYFIDIGDYYRCIAYSKRCETLAGNYARMNNGAESKTGLEYMLVSSLLRAQVLLIIEEYDAAEKLLSNKVDECKKSGFKDYLGTIYEQLAIVQKHKGNYGKAHQFLKNALKFYKDEGAVIRYKKILNTIGSDIYYNHFKNYDSALLFYRKALKIVNKDESLNKEDAFETLSILGNIANVYVQKGFYDSAFHFFQVALNQVKTGTNESDILLSSPGDFFEQEKMYYRTNLLIDKGNAYRKLYEEKKQPSAIKEALYIYKVTDQLLDRIKAGLTEYQSKLFWRNYSSRLYEDAIEACYLNNDATGAFYFFEKSRAVLLFDQLNEQRWLGENDILKQTELQKKILQIEREFSKTDKSSKKFNELESVLFIKKYELDILKQQIKTNNPLYYQNYLDTGFITIDEVKQRVLHDPQALLELFSGDKAVYSLLITSNDVYFNRISKNSFDSLTGLFINYISNSSLQNKYFTEFVNTSSRLYQLIFQNGTLPDGRIIISPDGQYFPFEALVTSTTSQPHTYFLNDHAVSYTYSARFLMNDFNSGSAKTGKNFMGIAPVNYPSSFSLAALPGSDRSLNKISSYFNNAVNRVASNASRNNFMQHFSQYRIIQFYTHAADSSINNEPVIYFADSALYLSDLINEYKPLTRLVVLSACETGTGKNYQGEGIFSFNRGFAALGIPAAITNLWSVDNESTYMLTELFYKWLAKGLPTDVALQKAKLEFLHTASIEKSMPCYWAGPVLVGKADVIELSKPFPWKWIVLFLSIGCIGFFAVRKWAISKKKA